MSILHDIRDHLVATAEAGEAELAALAAKVTGHHAQVAAIEAEIAKPITAQSVLDEVKAAVEQLGRFVPFA